MDNFLKTVLQMFADKAKNRIWPTFIAVWTLHNWRFLYLAIKLPAYGDGAVPIKTISGTLPDSLQSAIIEISLCIAFACMINIAINSANSAIGVVHLLYDWLEMKIFNWQGDIQHGLVVGDIRRKIDAEKAENAINHAKSSEANRKSSDIGLSANLRETISGSTFIDLISLIERDPSDFNAPQSYVAIKNFDKFLKNGDHQFRNLKVEEKRAICRSKSETFISKFEKFYNFNEQASIFNKPQDALQSDYQEMKNSLIEFSDAYGYLIRCIFDEKLS